VQGGCRSSVWAHVCRRPRQPLQERPRNDNVRIAGTFRAPASRVARRVAARVTFSYTLRDSCDRSLSILVTVEMFNALNALSERESLLVVKPWVNKSHFRSISSSCNVLQAQLIAFAVLRVARYTFLGKLVSIAPLTFEEWKLVVAVSAPVCLLEEMMKFFVRKLK